MIQEILSSDFPNDLNNTLNVSNYLFAMIVFEGYFSSLLLFTPHEGSITILQRELWIKYIIKSDISLSPAPKNTSGKIILEKQNQF